jgi:uncharacterized protein with NRDE domain
MCLVAVAWRAHPRYPLILAGNRDEFHERPSAGADWWTDAPHVIGGRDLVAGGSWLAFSRKGRFAVVTNHPGRPGGDDRPLSRGHLVRDWVTGNGDLPRGYLHRVAERESQYGGFCLVAGIVDNDPEGLIVPAGPAGSRWRLPEGITGIANGPREQLPPKAWWLEREYQRILGADEVSVEDLLRPLATVDPVLKLPPDADWKLRSRHTPFIRDERYGTRASTVVMVGADGEVLFREDRYGPDGLPTGTTNHRFRLTPPR